LDDKLLSIESGVSPDSLAVEELEDVDWRHVCNGVLDYETGSERGNLSDSPSVADLKVALVLDVCQSCKSLLQGRSATTTAATR
jgi:hypothetical protein